MLPGGAVEPFCGARFERFGKLNALDRNGVPGTIIPDQVSAFLEVPQAELEIDLGRIQQSFELPQTQAGLLRMRESPAIEQTQNFLAALHFVHHRNGGGRNILDAYRIPPLRFTMFAVIRTPPLRIAQDFVRVRNPAKRLRIPDRCVLNCDRLGGSS